MRTIIFLIYLILTMINCRGWYRMIPDVDAVDSVVYYRIKGEPQNRIVIKNPNSIKELGIIFNSETQREYCMKYSTTKQLKFYCKDTIITFHTNGRHGFRSEFYDSFSILNNIDDLMNRYYKKEQQPD